MQEETMAMSDDEISDEVVMVDPSQSSSGMPHNQRQLELQKRDQTVIDNQLKAVGLYEEGLSAEQKEELLAVIAASEETAQQEESMRTKAREWQQKVFPSELDVHTSSASSVCQSILQPAYVNVVSESEVQNSLQMLNIEGSIEPNVSLEIFQSPEKASTKKSSETCQEIQSCISSDNLNAVQRVQRQQVSRRGRPRRFRANCETNDAKAIRGSLVFHSSRNKLEHIKIDEGDLQRQRKDLEKYSSDWQPSNSCHVPLLLPHRRIQQKDHMVPYKCVTEQCGQPILSPVNKFHSAVTELQRSSPYYLQWGCPITVGRAYATRSTRSRGPDSENSDGVYNFHFPNISDQTPALSTSKNTSYLRLREFDKKYPTGLSIESASVARTKSSNPVISKVFPNSLNTINLKSTKASVCETVKQPETQSEIVLKSMKKQESTETKAPTESSVSNLIKSESIHLCKVMSNDNCDDCFSNSVSKTLLCKQRKSLSETDVSVTTNGPVLNSFGETNSEEVIENCGSPLIIVDDDDPFEEQENVVCTSEKGARRKRVSAKVSVTSPSKRLKGNNA